MLSTPEAQCIGRHTFYFALRYRNAATPDGEGFAVIEKHRHPAWVVPQRFDFEAVNPLAFLESLPQAVRLSVVKPAEAGDGVVVRLYNIGEDQADVSLPLPKNVTQAGLCNLAETWQADLPQADGQIKFPVRAGQIVSIYLKC